jgi:enoyl-CoA hydratase
MLKINKFCDSQVYTPVFTKAIHTTRGIIMLTFETKDGVALITLARAPANAFNDELAERLSDAVDRVIADDSVAVLHIRSSLKIFCAGADLALMRSCFANDEGIERMVEVVRDMQRLLHKIEAAPVISIAEIGGAALGGGLELALACDIRAAAVEAKLGLPEAGLGLIPGAGGTQRMTRLCGEAVAKRLILGGEVIDGATAERLGVVQWAHPREQLGSWTASLAARIAAMPRAALAASKSCVAAQRDPQRNGYDDEITATRMLYNHPESRRRVIEFLNRA